MAVNRDKVDLWKADVAKSVDFYNDWFINFAPKAFRETRISTTKQVAQALRWTDNLTNIRPQALANHPFRKTYGSKIAFNLFLCGYFDSGYLGYEAAEGIDWVWEHRINDLEKFGF